ncbi:MAG TPA: alkaline phosphatase family protein [Verrucomicrobiae bacterium]|nr:alkaline phosphatase family protein [Verrucomicrobiae bacterium]
MKGKISTDKTIFPLPSAIVAAVLALNTMPAVAGTPAPERVDHVLLISVDGMHQSDLAWYVQTHPSSTLAALANHGVDFSDASTPFPSDSFPGTMAQVTGGDPASTGIYYDDTWNHSLFPAGTTNCSGPAPGAEVTYFEALDYNFGALDAGQGIVPAPGLDPWANILSMTGNPLNVINPANLPVDPISCQPIYPNQYLKVNTIFEVAHQHHLFTAWSDKHPAYEIVSGPSGQGVDDYFTPEINSSANSAAPTDPNQDDWTKDNLSTQQYDNYKVQAVLNWINGHRHDGSGNPGTPAIFGMNFQTVSTAQKLPASRTESNLSGTALGGYQPDGYTPGEVLSNALDFVDHSLGEMVAALNARGLMNDTAIIISAKHGQSPKNLAALNRIKDGQIMDALNTAWNHDYQNGDPNATPLVAFGMNDDGLLLWLNDRSKTATDYSKQFLLAYSDSSASVDGKPVVSAGLAQVYTGSAAAKFIGVDVSDPRVPDVIGVAQYGVVYTSHKSKIAEHGGDSVDDRNVPILLSAPGVAGGTAVTRPVETTQIAPTILQLLGLNPQELQAVRTEGTPSLL